MTLSAADIDRIGAASETIERSLSVLADKQSLSREAYRNDRETRDVVERRSVKATEAAIDIAETLVVHERGDTPEGGYTAMVTLADAGVLDRGTAREMGQTARFRNILAHTYGGAIDNDDVYDALQDLERYRNFLHEVRTSLDETGALDS